LTGCETGGLNTDCITEKLLATWRADIQAKEIYEINSAGAVVCRMIVDEDIIAAWNRNMIPKAIVTSLQQAWVLACLYRDSVVGRVNQPSNWDSDGDYAIFKLELNAGLIFEIVIVPCRAVASGEYFMLDSWNFTKARPVVYRYNLGAV